MNKNYMFIGFIAVAGLGLVGAAFLFFVNSPSADKFVSYTFNTLSTIGAMGVAIWGLNKTHGQQEKMEGDIKTVKEQTNGNLHTRDMQIEQLKEEKADLMVKLAVAEKENEMMIKETPNV